jgi:uncharacterized protein (DUF4415 family)
MNGNKRNTGNTWTDPDDAPELGDEFFQQANQYDGERLVKRGRPAGTGMKSSTTVRFDTDIVEAFRAGGPGWQTRMNQALREWLDSHTVKRPD